MSSNVSPKSERLFYLDALRALLMLQVLPVHASGPYAVGREWFVSSPDKSWVLTWLTTTLSTFSMPGFFLISGFLTYKYLGKRDHTDWLMMRAMRLGVPLLTCVVVLSPIAIYAGTLSAAAGTEGALAAGFSPVFGESLTIIDGRWIGHLWFLPTLFIYTFGIWVLIEKNKLMPLLEWLSNQIERLKHPAVIWLGIIGVCLVWRTFVVGLFYFGEELSGLEWRGDGIINLRGWLMFIPFYLLGFVAGHRASIFENLLIVSRFRLILVGLAMAVYLYIDPINSFIAKVMTTLMVGLLGISLTGLAMALARRFMSKPSKFASIIGETSYGMYLFHYPIMVLLCVYMYAVNLPPIVEFMIIGGIGIFGSYLLTRIMLRVPLLAFLFNGIPFEETTERNLRTKSIQTA